MTVNTTVLLRTPDSHDRTTGSLAEVRSYTTDSTSLVALGLAALPRSKPDAMYSRRRLKYSICAAEQSREHQLECCQVQDWDARPIAQNKLHDDSLADQPWRTAHVENTFS